MGLVGILLALAFRSGSLSGAGACCRWRGLPRWSGVLASIIMLSFGLRWIAWTENAARVPPVQISGWVDVGCGSKASFRAWVGDFSFAPESRHQFVPH
jgi:hypothetical protein